MEIMVGWADLMSCVLPCRKEDCTKGCMTASPTHSMLSTERLFLAEQNGKNGRNIDTPDTPYMVIPSLCRDTRTKKTGVMDSK